jgi:hypothetical protein
LLDKSADALRVKQSSNLPASSSTLSSLHHPDGEYSRVSTTYLEEAAFDHDFHSLYKGMSQVLEDRKDMISPSGTPVDVLIELLNSEADPLTSTCTGKVFPEFLTMT